MSEQVAERFRLMVPVYDSMAEDETLLAEVERMFVEIDWKDAVDRAGGVPYGEPSVERVDNLRYGWPVTDENGEAVLGEDGEPLINRIRFYMVATGYAVRQEVDRG